MRTFFQRFFMPKVGFVWLVTSALAVVGWAVPAQADCQLKPGNPDVLVCTGSIDSGIDVGDYPGVTTVEITGLSTVLNVAGDDRAVGVIARGDEYTIANKTFANVFAAAFGDDSVGVGMAAIGNKNSIVNDLAFVEVYADGAGSEATGVIVVGNENLLVNELASFEVYADGAGSEAAGMVVEGDENLLVNDVSAVVAAETDGDHSLAAGMAVSGNKNSLLNNDMAYIHVYSKGDHSEAVGMTVEGDQNVLVNNDWARILAGANGAHTSAAGMVVEGDENMLRNADRADITVDAYGAHTSVSGMAVIGSFNELINQDAYIYAHSPGDSSKAVGMAVEGDENLLLNEDGAQNVANAEGALSSAAGMAVTGNLNSLINQDAGIYAYADGAGSEASGMVVVGSWNELINQDADIYVYVDGAGSAAVGMAAVGGENQLLNKNWAEIDAEVSGAGSSASGMAVAGNLNSLINQDEARIDVYADGDGSAAVGMAAEGDRNFLLNAAHIEAEAFGEGADAIGVDVWGNENVVQNARGANIIATATGDKAAASAVIATGSGHWVINEGFIEARAAGTDARAIGVHLVAEAEGADLLFFNHEEAELISDAGGGLGYAVLVEGDDVADDALIKVVNEGFISGDIAVRSEEGEVLPVVIVLTETSTTLGDVRLGKGDGDRTVQVWAGAQFGEDSILDGEEAKGSRLHLTGSEGNSSRIQAMNFKTILVDGGDWEFGDGHGLELETLTIAPEGRLVLVGIAEITEGGRVEGNGTFNGNLRNNGTLAPGQSPGKITIVGSYTHGAGARYEVEIGAPDAGGNREWDQLEVLAGSGGDGSVDVQGGALEVILEGSLRRHRGHNEYVIISAEGGLHGTFDQFQPQNHSLYLVYDVEYVHGNADGAVKLHVTGLGFEDVSRTPNQREVARVLDDDGTPDDSELVLALLSAGSEAEAQKWLDLLSGEVHTTYPMLATAGMDGFSQAVSRGMATAKLQSEGQAWLTLHHTSGRLRGDGSYAGADFDVRGGVIGIDLVNQGRGRLGLVAGLSSSRLDMADRTSSMNSEGHELGVYGEYATDSLLLTGVAAFGTSRHNTDRRIAIGSGVDALDERATGRASSREGLISLRGEGRNDREGTTLTPFFGVSWLSLDREGFAEDGAREATLRLDRYETSLTQGDLGLRLNMRPTATRGGWQLSRSLWASWLYDFSSPKREMSLRFDDPDLPDDAMKIRGVQRSRSGVQVGLALEGTRGDEGRVGWSLQYKGEFREQLQQHAVHVGLSYRF